MVQAGKEKVKEKTKKGSFDPLSPIWASLIVGLLFALPQVIAAFSMPGYSYFSTDRMINDDSIYMTRLMAFANGRFQADAVLYEHSGDHFPVEIIERIVAFPLAALFHNAMLVEVVFLFLAGFSSAYVCQKLLSLFIEGKKARVVAMLLVLTSGWLYYFPPWSLGAAADMVNALPFSPKALFGTLGQGDLVPYSLFVNARLYFQMFGYPLLFALLWLLATGWDKKERTPVLIAGVVAGALAYTYLFMFIIGGILLGFYLIRAFATRDREQMVAFGSACAIALLLSLPYLIGFISLIKSSAYLDIEQRLGTQYGKFLKSDLMMLKYVALVAAIAILRPRGWEHIALPLLAIAAGASTHIITGKFVQVEHFYAIGAPFMMLALLSLVAVEAERRLDGRVFPLLAALIIVALVARQVNTGLQLPSGETTGTYAAKAELHRFLSTLPADKVLLALPSTLNIELNAETGNYAYLPNAYLTYAPTEELEERLLLAYRYCGVPTERLDSLLKGEDQSDWFYFFHMKYECDPEYGKTAYCEDADDGLPSRRVPKSRRDALLAEYTSMDNDALITAPYRADYLIKQNGASPACDAGGKVVFSNTMFEVVEVPKAG